MLAEARAQYEMRPSDYLEGVATALLQTLEDVPFVDGRQDADQAAQAAGRTARARVRDFLHGQSATLQWILGEAGVPPVPSVLTEPEPEQGTETT
jgi:hypothetical protein